MNFNDRSKANILEIAYKIGQCNNELRICIAALHNGDDREKMIASWAMMHAAKKKENYNFLNNFEEDISILLSKKSCQKSVRRNLLAVFQYIYLPESIMGKLFENCLDYISNPQEETAISAYSITVAARIVNHYPELRNEFILTIKTIENDTKASIQIRLKKALNQFKT